MKKLQLLVCTCLCILGGRCFAAEKPNILFLLSDDHSYPYLGCYGNKDVRTPNLDRLASQGMRFDRMFVGCPQCVPSRACLMTGRSAVAVRMVRFTSPLPAEVPALPDLLRDKAGYFTGVGGRTYHLDGPPTKGTQGASVIGEVLDREGLRTFTNRVDYVEKPGPMRDFGGKLARFLDAAPKDKPWFFWLGFSDPHHVWDTQGPQGVPDPTKLTLPGHLPDLPGVRGDLARYIAEVEHLDGDVQSVLDVLEKRGLANNTVVVFMGDNGMALPHGKGALTDPGIAVPLLVRWPGVVRPGAVTRTLVSGEDFAPTMLEIAGVAPLKEMSGVSYLKLLRGEAFEGRKYIFAERGPHGGRRLHRPVSPARHNRKCACSGGMIWYSMSKDRVAHRKSSMKQYLRRIVIAVVAGAAATSRAAETRSQPAAPEPYAGSASCRQCHEPFYQLWAPSHHGLAMQPYTFAFAQANLTAPEGPLKIGRNEYVACLGPEEGWILERGPDGERRHRIVHVMGGKNVYYFLTPLDRGRLQTLPIAYDVRTRKWFDTAASGVRHFPGAAADTPVHWTDSMYTFNTSCHGCHVSQLSTNYDLKTDTYRTTWAEPGINCEACHGPAQEHVRVCQAVRSVPVRASEGTPHGVTTNPQDLKIIRTKPFTAEQINSMCGSCHAKLSPVSASFRPGDRFFDRFDLTTLEHPDFYPDGRDLGENYTMTSWRMSPCARSGKLDCRHCHTSSGRYRFAGDEKPNAACLPCHQEKVDNAAAHTHHKADSTGNRCIACHMPMTEFARMTRSDHSMRPPTPAATLQFKSPNACNLCHKDKDAAWADQQVRQWHKEDYQKPVLDQAALVDAARRGDWRQLGAILGYIGSKDREEIVAASLVRLLHGCNSAAKWPVVIQALREDPSPLVRAAAAQTLEGHATPESLSALAQATADQYLLVRVRAAGALAGIPIEQLPSDRQEAIRRATAQLLDALRTRPDDYASQYNLGNFHLQRGDRDQALASFQTALKLRPDFVPPYVNVAFVYNAKGENDKAEASFRRALALDPNNPVVHLNLGMLLAEMKRPADAEQAFRRCLALDPNSAVAAYNLAVLLAPDRPYESLRCCQRAYQLQPQEGKYGYTYAYFLHQRRETDEAVKVLQDLVRRKVPYADAYALLGEIHLQRGQWAEAAGVYRAAWANGGLTQNERDAFRALLGRLEGSGPPTR